MRRGLQAKGIEPRGRHSPLPLNGRTLTTTLMFPPPWGAMLAVFYMRARASVEDSHAGPDAKGLVEVSGGGEDAAPRS